MFPSGGCHPLPLLIGLEMNFKLVQGSIQFVGVIATLHADKLPISS
jgi:hypothetical protein